MNITGHIENVNGVRLLYIASAYLLLSGLIFDFRKTPRPKLLPPFTKIKIHKNGNVTFSQ